MRETVSRLREWFDAGDHVFGVGAGGGAVADAAGDALEDAGEAKGVVGEIPIERGDAVASCLRAIERDIVVKRGDA